MSRLPFIEDAEIEAMLADPAYQGHPLRSALSALWEQYGEQLRRMRRVTRLSDNFQAMAHARELGRSQQIEKQLRQLEKITRISDRYQSMMRELNIALEQASTHDLLTGLANRRLLLARLKAECERSERREGSFSVALVDIDRFKRINDNFGHDAGDRVLVAIGRAMTAALREYDLCGRWGGEEFLILLADARVAEAGAIMQRVQESVRALRYPGVSAELQVTVSIGVAQYDPQERVEQTVNRADAALLQAKREGRDRMVIAD